MAFAVDDIIIRVRVEGQKDLDDLRRAQDDVRDGAGNAGDATEGLSSSLLNAAASVQLMTAAVGGLAAAFNALKAPADLAINFERQFALVSTLSDKVGKDLERGLLDLASRVPQTAGDITKATYQAISAGIDPGDVLNFLDAASKAAVAGNSTITESVEALTTSVNAFKTQGVSAAQASDVLFATVKAGVTTFGELNASLGQASAVASYGVSIEEVGAAVANLTKLGFSTSDAITRVNAAVKAIAGPTGDAAKEFKRLGVEVGINRLQAVGLSGVLADIQKATGGSAAAVAKLTRRFEGQQGLLGLLGSNYSEFRTNLDRTTNAAGETEAAFAKLNDTTGGVIDNFQSTVEVALTELGQELLPTITDAVREMGDVIAREGPAMIESLKAIAVTITSITGAAIAAAGALARVYNFGTGGDRDAAKRRRERERGASRADTLTQFATGGEDLNAILATGGTDALQTFERQRRAEISAAQASAREEFNRASRELAAAREAEAAVQAAAPATTRRVERLGAGRFEFGGPADIQSATGADVLSAQAAAARTAKLEAAAQAAEDRLRALSGAEGALVDAIGKALDAAPAGSPADLVAPEGDTPPKLPTGRRPARTIDTGPGGFAAFAGAINRGSQVALAGAGQGLDFIAAQAAEREAAQARNEQLLAIGSDLAERRLALVEDESTRRLAQLSLRHQQELEAIGEFEEQRTQLLAVQAAERERLEQQTSRAIRESVARDSAATLGSLADLGEAFGATSSIVSVIRATALAADAIYFGIKGAGYQAEAIGAFATLNVPQGLALQAAAIKHFAQSALAAKGAIQLGASAAAGGGGSGGGALGASRAQTDSRRDGRVSSAREQQAPSLTIVLSDAVAISDRPEIIRPMVASLAQELRRQMNTRGGTRLPAAG